MLCRNFVLSFIKEFVCRKQILHKPCRRIDKLKKQTPSIFRLPLLAVTMTSPCVLYTLMSLSAKIHYTRSGGDTFCIPWALPIDRGLSVVYRLQSGRKRSAWHTHSSRQMQSLVPELVYTYRVGQVTACILQPALQRTACAGSGMASRSVKPKKPVRMGNHAGPLSSLIRIGLTVLLGGSVLPRIGSVVADAVDYYPGSGEKQGTTVPLGGSRNMLERRESFPGEHRCRRNRMGASICYLCRNRKLELLESEHVAWSLSLMKVKAVPVMLEEASNGTSARECFKILTLFCLIRGTFYSRL